MRNFKILIDIWVKICCLVLYKTENVKLNILSVYDDCNLGICIIRIVKIVGCLFNCITDGKFAILAAVKESKLKVLEVLLKRGANPIHLTLNKGDKPIHAALTIGLERNKGQNKIQLCI